MRFFLKINNMKIEGSFCSLEDMLLGIMTCRGEDENGEFSMVSVGFLFFEFSLTIYNQQT